MDRDVVSVSESRSRDGLETYPTSRLGLEGSRLGHGLDCWGLAHKPNKCNCGLKALNKQVDPEAMIDWLHSVSYEMNNTKYY